MTLTAGACHKKKAIFIMGATGTGKSRLSVDLATHFPAEIINSDKIQVYKGLDIVTNKLPEPDRQGIRHYLLDEHDPDADFTATDFCYAALSAMDAMTSNGHVPIIVGGSNNYIEELIEGPAWRFRLRYEPCFICLSVAPHVLYKRVSMRVDEMVAAGLVEEVERIFDPDADYEKGIRRAIGVPELYAYMHARREGVGEEETEALLRVGIEEIKVNTCKLVDCQVAKITRLRDELGWEMCTIDVTRVFDSDWIKGVNLPQGGVWDTVVLRRAFEYVRKFLA